MNRYLQLFFSRKSQESIDRVITESWSAIIYAAVRPTIHHDRFKFEQGGSFNSGYKWFFCMTRLSNFKVFGCDLLP